MTRPRRFLRPALTAALSAAGVLTLCGLALVWLARSAGVSNQSTSLWFIGPLTVAIALTGASGVFLLVRGERAVGGWLAAVGLGAVMYLLLSGFSAWWVGALGRRDTAASLLVGLQINWYVVSLVLIQVTFVVAHDRVRGTRSRLRRPFTVAMLSLAALNVAVLGVLEPVDDLTYPEETGTFPGLGPVGPRLPGPTVDAISWVLSIPWLIGMLVAPILLWHTVPRSAGRRRPRLALAAVSSILPVCTVVFCVTSVELTVYAGLVSSEVAGSLLNIAYGAAFMLAPAGLAVAVGASDTVVAQAAPRLTGAALTAVIGTLSTIIIVLVSALLGARLGPGAVVPIVLATLAVAGALVPVHRRLVRVLTLRMDPGRATAARLLVEAGTATDLAVRTNPARVAHQILRRAVGDPAARLVLRLPEGRGWVDPEGAPAAAPDPNAPTCLVLGPDGQAHAYLDTIADPADAAGPLAELDGLLDAAVLEFAVRDQAGRLAAERARADAAATDERRRLERDLHDGVQGRLLALALELRMAQSSIDDGAAQLVLADTLAGLRTALDELRALAAGDTPELLARTGLRGALADLAARVPLPVNLDLPAGRLPAGTETVAYLVICEAVTNALKHAAAAAVEVRVSVEPGGEVATVVVCDDGRGGADLRAGTGLRGLAERVGTVGGRLVVSDRRPRGTRLEVTLPCAP